MRGEWKWKQENEEAQLNVEHTIRELCEIYGKVKGS